MSKSFQAALSIILKFEGGYTDDQRDLGNAGNSATNFGITQRTYDAYRKTKGKFPANVPMSVKYIQEREVVDIYRRFYWLPAGCDEMPNDIALCTFDWHVQSGGGVRLLQGILGSKVDNIFGKGTLNDLTYFLKKHTEQELIKRYMMARRSLYDSYAKRPGQEVFLEGWINRCDELERVLSVR